MNDREKHFEEGLRAIRDAQKCCNVVTLRQIAKQYLDSAPPEAKRLPALPFAKIKWRASGAGVICDVALIGSPVGKFIVPVAEFDKFHANPDAQIAFVFEEEKVKK